MSSSAKTKAYLNDKIETEKTRLKSRIAAIENILKKRNDGADVKKNKMYKMQKKSDRVKIYNFTA